MDNGVIFTLAKANPNMSDIDRLVNIYWALSSVLAAGIPGDIVEAGCNAGHTSVFLQMIIDELDPTRRLHLFDSFEGLPDASEVDEYLKPGELVVTVEEVEANFDRWGLAHPEIHKGWFSDTMPKQMPDQVAFAYLDGDYYESIQTSWRHIYPRMTKNAIAMVDDYGDVEKNPQAWDGLPAVKKACDEFLSDKPESLSVLVGTGDLAMGYLRKQ